jgi:hypothetical protein
MTSRGSKNRKQPEPFVIKRRVRPTLVTPSADDDEEANDRDDDRVVTTEEEEEEAEEEYIAPRGRITFTASVKRGKQQQRRNVKTEQMVGPTTTKKRQRDESTSDEIPLVRVKKEKVEDVEAVVAEEEDEQPPIKWEEEDEEEEGDDEEADLPLRKVKRERRLSLSAAVKKEEDDDGMPVEAGGGGGGNNKKEKERMSVGDGGTTRALGALVEQYMNTESYDEINADSTSHVHGIIREFEDYVYGLTQQGMAGGSVIFEYCHQLIEAIHLWNGNIRTEQANIRDFVLNCIAYNKELYDLYIEQTKRGSASSAAATGGGRNKRNPASLFNTVPTSLTHISLSNVNPSLISSSGGSSSSNSNLPVTGDEPPLTNHISNIF